MLVTSKMPAFSQANGSAINVAPSSPRMTNGEKIKRSEPLQLLGRARTLLKEGDAQGEIVMKYGPEDVSVSTQHTVGTAAFLQFLQNEYEHIRTSKEKKLFENKELLSETKDDESLVSNTEQFFSENLESVDEESDAEKITSATDDPLKGFKETLFGEGFDNLLNLKKEELIKGIEAGETISTSFPGDNFLKAVSDFINDANASGKIEVEYSSENITFKTNHRLGTEKLLEILDLVLGDGKEIKVLDREAGRKLVQIMAKYGRQYMKQEGIPITEAGFKKLVKEAAKSGENGGIVFKGGKPEEVQKDLREWSNSLTMVDNLFFGKIFSGGICQRKAVFDEIAKAVASERPELKE